MRYGIPLLKDRVSPRCTIADSIMIVDYAHGQMAPHTVLPLESGAWTGLIQLLMESQVDAVVTGGIARETRQILVSYGLSIIDNVACSASELLEAVAGDKLQPGFGFLEKPAGTPITTSVPIDADTDDEHESRSSARSWETQGGKLIRFDCLNCTDRVCLRGEPCYPPAAESYAGSTGMSLSILEAARDISCEEDRQLCRVAELVYFCHGMKFRRIGIAYCIDLMEPAGILTGLLRRFFDVFPVCCKVGGVKVDDPLTGGGDNHAGTTASCVACNPAGQAQVLNNLGTDLNVVVGLCLGVDCLFSQTSQAPVTTLFVKDKSLVNNPIGAIYSDYYLNEVTRALNPESA